MRVYGTVIVFSMHRGDTAPVALFDDDQRFVGAISVALAIAMVTGGCTKKNDNDPGSTASGASGKTYKVSGTIKQGISSEDAKKITKLIRDEGPKGVKTQIQGDEVRVSSKKRDDLQAVIAMLKKADLDVALQFVNYR